MANIKTASSEICMISREKFFENIKCLYEAEKLCDVTLIAGKKRIPAHRVVLSAATPYFAAMFTNELQEKKQKEITLHEIHENELKMLIDFFYTGIIDINERNVYDLLDTASRIEVTLVEDTCARFLWDNLNVSNCLMTWTLTESFANLKALTEKAKKFVEEKFVEIVATEHVFLLLDPSFLTTLLRSDALNVYSEEEVFNALSKWVRYDQVNRRCHVKDLLKNIRFSQLKLKFLSENVSAFCNESNELDSMKDICQWKLLPRDQLPMSARPSSITKRIIAIGNDWGSSSENRYTEVYSAATNKWQIFKEFKCELVGFCSVILDDELFILGGYCSRSKKNMKSVEKYDFLTKQLRQMEPMIEGRNCHAATVLNNEIFVAGGVGQSSVEKFDPKVGSWSEVSSMLQVRRSFALIAVSGRIFAVGGRVIEGQDLNSVECYDPYKKRWEYIAPMNRYRCAHSVVVHRDDRLFVIGGLDGISVDDSIEYYDPTIDKWTLIGTLSVPRYGFSVINFEGFVVLAGGECGGIAQSRTVIKIDFENLSQENMSAMNLGRRYLKLAEIPCYNPEN